MKQTINQYQFADAFRSIRPDNFTYAGLHALFDYLEQYEDDTGEEVELDVVSICCDWCEYASAQEAAQAYGWKPDNDIAEDGNECDGEAMQFLSDLTQVIELKGGAVVIQNF